MKRFTLALALIAMMGLNIGCGGGESTPPAEENTPAETEGGEGGGDDTPAEPETPAE